MSKENGITIILVIILYEFIFNKKGDIKNITKRELFVLVALFIMLLLPLIVYRSAIYANFTTEYKRWGFTLGERYLTQFRVLVFALSLLLLPLPQWLSATHDIAVSKSLFSPTTTLPSIFLMTFLFIFSLVRMKKNPYFSFAVLFFFATMSVEIIMPIELFYEQRMYLPSIFLIGVAVDFIVNNYYDKHKRFVIVTFLIIVVLFSAFTLVRSEAWKSELTLWNDVLSKYPKNGRAIHNIGIFYSQKGDNKKALEYYEKALRYYDEQTLNVSVGAYGEGRQEVAGAYYSAGIALYSLGNYNTALKYYEKALEIDFKIYGEEHPNVAKVYNNIGLVWAKLGDYKKVLEYSEKALNIRLKVYGEIHPTVAGAYNNIGVTYNKLGDYKKALEYYEKAYAIYVKLLGEENPTTKQVKMNIEKIKAAQ